MLVQINNYAYINTKYITGITLDSDSATVYFVGEPKGCVYSRSEGEILLKALQAPRQKDLDNIRKAIMSYVVRSYVEICLDKNGISVSDDIKSRTLDDIMDTIKGDLYGL
jgi:hypothetical protein